MAGQFPLSVQRLVNLAEAPFNLPTTSFRYNNLTVESDQFVCAKDISADGSNQVVVVDLHNDNAVSKRPTKKAEAALMHTKQNIIVLKGANESGTGHFIQIFNLDLKQRLLEHRFDDDVVFWKWPNDSTLAVITASAVWHCPLDGSAPTRVFERAGALSQKDGSSVQIINYCVDPTNTWCLLAGISTRDKKSIDGHLQLYNLEKQQQQFLEGHAGCFGNIIREGADGITQTVVPVLSFTEKKNGVFRVHVIDISANRVPGEPSFRYNTEFQLAPEAPLDFPLFEHLSGRHGVIYIVTRSGYCLVLDAITGTQLIRQQISKEALFVACPDTRRGGVITVNRRGEVLAVNINEMSLVPYIQQQLRHTLSNANEIALSLVRRHGLGGADDVLLQLFNASFARGDYNAAARVAATMKSGTLRSPAVMNQFKNAPAQPGKISPILVYFTVLLEQGRLNENESLELVRPVVAQGRREFIQKWLDQDKLECTEQLGDLIKPLDVSLALRVYEQAKAATKVLQAYVELEQFDKIIAYAKKTNLRSDYSMILRNMANLNPEGAVTFAKDLLNHEPSPLIEPDQVISVFVQLSRLQEMTSIMLDFLKTNKPEHGGLQTRVLELNLTHAPQVAEAIFQAGILTQYDRPRIGKFCEKAGLAQRALEHFTDHNDIKRVLSSGAASSVNVDWLTKYFTQLPPETCLECLGDMLRVNKQHNLRTIVQVAVKQQAAIGTSRLIQLFEAHNALDGIFYFLGSVVAFSNDPDVHLKYIEAAAKLNHVQEVERMCRETNQYDPVRVKDFLKEAKLADPRPLIYVCDRHDFVPELTEYLFRNGFAKYIEVYCVKVSPHQTPKVVGVLLDLDASEDMITNILSAVGQCCPVEALVAEVERRNRLRLILPWLEARAAEGSNEPALHDALAKVYIDLNQDAEAFLSNNKFYNPRVVGNYCEDRDPHLAYKAYTKNFGECDDEILNLTNSNALFRLQARYLVERQNAALWAKVLTSDNEYRDAVVEQVVGAALPESTNAEEVSVAVHAFIAANLPAALIELLEKIVLHNTNFANNKILQNLLLLTAIKSEPSRVSGYINRLDEYDGPEIADVLISETYGMYDEAVTIYTKAGMNDEAMNVLTDKLQSLDRAEEFARRVDQRSVWEKLGQAQLAKGLVVEAIDSFLRSGEPGDTLRVISVAEEQQQYEKLVQYLFMVRKKRAAQVDSVLLYALAKSGKRSEMEEFVAGSNTANVQQVGDRLAEEGEYDAAKILYATVPNFARLASCHLHLQEFSAAVESARRVNSPKTWKDVCVACVRQDEMQFAHIAGLAVVGHADLLEEVIATYEKLGKFDHLLTLLEDGISSDKAPAALVTELGIAYAKFAPEKLMPYLKSPAASSTGRLNIPKLIRCCERYQLWFEAVYLHTLYREFDQACSTMMQHPSAYDAADFKSAIKWVSNAELYYRAAVFFQQNYPLELADLLIGIADKVDHSRIVQSTPTEMRPLLKPYLEHVQTVLHSNTSVVNNALNAIYIEEEDVEGLRRSLMACSECNQLSIAADLETHELVEMRRIGTLLYRKNGQFDKAIELSKRDHNFADAIDTAKESNDPEVVEKLLRYFVVQRGDKECFAACLITCYSLLRPDVVLELAWRTKSYEEVMPFFVQTLCDFKAKHAELEDRLSVLEAATKEANPTATTTAEPFSAAPTAASLASSMGGLALMPAPAQFGGLDHW